MAGAKLSVADTTYLSDVLGHLGLSAPQAHQLLEKQTGCFHALSHLGSQAHTVVFLKNVFMVFSQTKQSSISSVEPEQ